MILGFTGTREGMTDRQRRGLILILSMSDMEKSVFHHGNCIGADKQAADTAAGFGWEIHSHPCNIPFMQAETDADVVYEIKSPHVRNQDIVDACDLLIAAPKSMVASARSGTWDTIRRAYHSGKPVAILEP